MEKVFTSEDIIALILAIAALYGVITLFQKKLQQIFSAKMELYKWGMCLKLPDNQQKYLMQLWYFFKTNKKPIIINEDLLSLEDRLYLEKISQRAYLPEHLKFAYSENTRKRYYDQLVQQGFSEYHAVLLCGLLLNKIAGISSIKKITYKYIEN